MVRRVCIALLVTTIVAQSAQAQGQANTGRGSLVGWLKSKVTGSSQQSSPSYARSGSYQKTSAREVQQAVAVATGRTASPQYRQVSGQRSQPFASQQQAAPSQQAAQQRAAQYRAAQQRVHAQYAAAANAKRTRTQQPQAQRPPMPPQQRPVVQRPYPPTQQVSQRQTTPAPRAAQPRMSQQQMQAYQARMAQARQYQAAQQRQMQTASAGRTAPVRNAPMTRRLTPTPASASRAPVPTRPVAMSSYTEGAPMYGGGSGYSTGMYPTTSAGLYSSPRPNIPYQMGMTAITNQAFYPHEYLYAHEYKAIYPPYYYKVKGHWMTTPFGVWSHENWKPMGTEVNVKYRSRISPFSGFIPPNN
ncbi:MAG: hypothetical protein AB8G99_06845 [Planctomycetaceae bacterium]